MEDPSIPSSRHSMRRQAQDIAARLFLAERDGALPLLGRDYLWINQSTIQEVEGTFLGKLEPEGQGRFLFRNSLFWQRIDEASKDVCWFTPSSRKDIPLSVENEARVLIRQVLRLESTSGSLSAVREIFHFQQKSYENFIPIYLKQRVASVRGRRQRSPSPSAQSLQPITKKPFLLISPPVHEPIPFHTFSTTVRYTPFAAATPNWKSFFCAQYEIDLWKLEPHERLEIKALVMQAVRTVAILVSNFPTMKISNTMSPHGYDLVPPPVPPSRLELDESDEAKMVELEKILSMPHVRVSIPYVIWHIRRHRYYELPHWSGGYYKGWCAKGMPHGHGELLMLMPSGSLLGRAEWSFGDLHGLCTMEFRDTQQNLVTRFQGEYRKNIRLFGEQEWFDASGAIVKKFSGSWNGDQPGDGVWTYTSAN